MKALEGAFNQEKALVGAFSVIVQPVVEPMQHYTALVRLDSSVTFSQLSKLTASRYLKMLSATCQSWQMMVKLRMSRYSCTQTCHRCLTMLYNNS